MALQMMHGWDDFEGELEDTFDTPERGFYPTTITRTGAGYSMQVFSDYARKRAILTPRDVAIVGSAIYVPAPYAGYTAPGFFFYSVLSLVAVGGVSGYQGVELIIADGEENRMHVRTSAGGGPTANPPGTYPTTFVLPYDRWFYLELKAKLASDGTGLVEARVNGATIFEKHGFSTQNASGGNQQINRAEFGYVGIPTLHDDSYVVDTTGAVANDFLGDVRIAALRPSAPGDSTQWTPSPAPNWDAANGVTGTTLSTKVSAATPGLRDLYALPDLSGNLEVFGVQVVAATMKNQVADPNVGLLTKAAGTTKQEGAAAAASPPATVVPYTSIPAGTTNVGGAPVMVADPDTVRGTTQAIECADIGDNGDTSYTFTFTLSAARAVAFRYHIGSEAGYDFGSITLDGTQLVRTSGSTAWATTPATALAAGAHTVQVRYTKDSIVSSGFDNIHLGSMLTAASVSDFAEAPAGNPLAAKLQAGVVQVLDPAGNPWTVETVNAMQIGLVSL